MKKSFSCCFFLFLLVLMTSENDAFSQTIQDIERPVIIKGLPKQVINIEGNKDENVIKWTKLTRNLVLIESYLKQVENNSTSLVMENPNLFFFKSEKFNFNEIETFAELEYLDDNKEVNSLVSTVNALKQSVSRKNVILFSLWILKTAKESNINNQINLGTFNFKKVLIEELHDNFKIIIINIDNIHSGLDFSNETSISLKQSFEDFTTNVEYLKVFYFDKFDEEKVFFDENSEKEHLILLKKGLDLYFDKILDSFDIFGDYLNKNFVAKTLNLKSGSENLGNTNIFYRKP